ncbi:putative T6SS immunity periplasmic lipoprotein [Cronobacter dublinensis]|uniref:putative T6SS immunity periplasmic lipoprotein n=1 Tax=Cronobacter dublinensis TaxID=413497 RepID=UPI003AE2F4B5
MPVFEHRYRKRQNEKGFSGERDGVLFGCAGSGDRLPDVQVGQVTLIRHTPCITYRVVAGDRLSSIQIADNASGGKNFHKIVQAPAIYPQSGKCLPTLGYHFGSGRKYVVYYSLDNPHQERERIVEVNFSLP